MPEYQQTQKSTESKTTSQRQATPRIQVPSSHPASIIQRARMNPKSLTHADVMQLQRTIGNQAVVRLLTEIGVIPSKAKQAPPVQRQELVQRQEIPEEEEPLQGKFEGKPEKEICPSCMQRQEIPEEKEPLQGKMIGTIQRQEIPEEEEQLQTKKENNTGMPDNLKAGVENLSGIDMSNVRVHYNSDKPADVGALAYTQGTNIHVAPGQERYLPHEAWHVVQQKQRRVQPTMQLKYVTVNDDEGLEHEADVMGERIIQMRSFSNTKSSAFVSETAHMPIQMSRICSKCSHIFDDSVGRCEQCGGELEPYFVPRQEELRKMTSPRQAPPPAKELAIAQQEEAAAATTSQRPMTPGILGRAARKEMGTVNLGGKPTKVFWDQTDGKYYDLEGRELEGIQSERYYAEGTGLHAFNIAGSYPDRLVKGTEYLRKDIPQVGELIREGSSRDYMRPDWQSEVSAWYPHLRPGNLKYSMGEPTGNVMLPSKHFGPSKGRTSTRKHDLLQLIFPKLDKVERGNEVLPLIDGFLRTAVLRVKQDGQIKVVLIKHPDYVRQMETIIGWLKSGEYLPLDLVGTITEFKNVSGLNPKFYEDSVPQAPLPPGIQLPPGREDLKYRHNITGVSSRPGLETANGDIIYIFKLKYPSHFPQ